MLRPFFSGAWRFFYTCLQISFHMEITFVLQNCFYYSFDNRFDVIDMESEFVFNGATY
jgi:hypothetical protein